MQVPAVNKLAVAPATVQTAGVVVVKVTVNPEVAVAESPSDVPTSWAGIDANAMLCALSFTAKLRVTGLAGR